MVTKHINRRVFRKTVPSKKGFPPKLYFPTPEDLDKRRLQLSKWLSSLLPDHEKEVEEFMKNQRAKYEEDQLEGVEPTGEMLLYL